jgi:hypothetical protein
MLLRLLRRRSWWPGRGRSAVSRGDPNAGVLRGRARTDAPASQAGVSQAGARQAGARQARRPAGPPGSHRKTQASGAVGRQRNGVGSGRPAPGGPGPAAPAAAAVPGATAPANSGRPAARAGAHRVSKTAASGTAPTGTAPTGTVLSGAVPSSAVPSSTVPGGGAARVAIRLAPDTLGSAQAAGVASPAQSSAGDTATAGSGQPWYAAARSGRADLGLRDCGVLERVLIREWDAGKAPAPQTVASINRLAGLPQLIKEKLAAGLDAIHVGDGGVPDLDHMGELKGVLLPSGRATWDVCAGAYGDRKIIVGSRPSPTPDVVCHEVGHALDDIDGPDGTWQSDSAAFAAVYDRCFPHLASEFHRRDGASSRREFFADAFAAIASAQRPALVEMLSGNTRSALDVMLYFNVRYGI